MNNSSQFVKPLKVTQDYFENFLFWSRWLQAPLYLGLVLAQLAFAYKFFQELWHLIFHINDSTTTDITVMLAVLGLIDVVMVANLVVMIVIGGYQIFVSKLVVMEDHPDQPEWLAHVNAGVLKIKLATAIISISSIHLLKSFINAASLTSETLMWQTIIHITFLLSALLLAWVDKMMNQTLLLGKH